jgi:uncharacterized protein (DUF952 family)
MGFCPIPHSPRDRAWLLIGFAAGTFISAIRRYLSSARVNISVTVPKRVFKLATSSEADAFLNCGIIESTLDKQDGFVHLSDRSSPRKVAQLFFSNCKDLQLIELDAAKLTGKTQWIVGLMGDAPPSAATMATAATTVHYLIADGCVHVYGESVRTSAIVRQVVVPLGADGVHVFPSWL